MKRILILLGCLLAVVAGAQTRLTINTGTAANDGSGDSLRAAFGKVNTNFATLWNTVYTNGTGGGGGTNYLFDSHWFTVSGTNVTIKSTVTLTNDFAITNAAKNATFGPFDSGTFTSTNTAVVGLDNLALAAPVTSISASSELDLLTPSVMGLTATTGQYLKLVNASSGKAEWATAAFLPLAGGTMSGQINAGGIVIANVGTPSSSTDAATKAYVDANAPGLVTNLRAWTQGAAYQLTTATYDSDNVLSYATVTWPDGSSGTFTRTSKNATFLTVDAFTITHATSGKTVTQSAVTRNANGSITAQPALSVTP